VERLAMLESKRGLLATPVSNWGAIPELQQMLALKELQATQLHMSQILSQE
jgi:hypothetical protein